MLAYQYPELEKPVFCVKKMSLLEKWRDYQFHKNLWKEDARMRELYVREEGLAEGHAKGRNNEKLETAIRMKGIGETTEKIQLITGLSAEIIEQL